MPLVLTHGPESVHYYYYKPKQRPQSVHYYYYKPRQRPQSVHYYYYKPGHSCGPESVRYSALEPARFPPSSRPVFRPVGLRPPLPSPPFPGRMWDLSLSRSRSRHGSVTVAFAGLLESCTAASRKVLMSAQRSAEPAPLRCDACSSRLEK